MNRFLKGLLIAFALFLCLSLGWFLSGLLNESRSVGIIGGSDGPTAIFVAGPDHHNHK